MTDRRAILAASLVVALGGRVFASERRADMYGMIGKITAVPGQRDALAKLLLSGSGDMPGCLSYVVSEDMKDPNALWVTEAWDSKDSHSASLNLPAVREAIVKARPLIAGFDTAAELKPIGGLGLGTKSR